MFPFVDVTVFCHILPFSRITSIFMFKDLELILKGNLILATTYFDDFLRRKNHDTN